MPTTVIPATTVTIQVDASNQTVTVDVAEVHGTAPTATDPGTKFTWQLQLVNPGSAEVKAFLEVPNTTILQPDQATSDSALQHVVFPFQELGGALRKPKFTAAAAGRQTVIVTVHFPNSALTSLPVSSVVIIDM